MNRSPEDGGESHVGKRVVCMGMIRRWAGRRDAAPIPRRGGPAGRPGARRGPWRTGAAALLLAAPLLAAPAPAAGQGQGLAADDAVLRPGDMLRVSVWRREELSGDFRVTAEGTLHHPLYRSVEVANVPLETAEARLLDYLSRLETDPQVAIQPLFRVIVGGEVRTPGVFDFPPETTIGDAVALAGGPTQEAREVVTLVRGGRELELDLRDPDSRAASMTVRSGDEVIMERRSSFNFMQHVFLPVMTTASTVVGIIRLVDR